VELIREIVQKRRYRHGSPRAREGLRRDCGKGVSRKKAAALTRKRGLNARGRRKFVRTAGSRHSLPACSDILSRQFHAEGLGEKRVSDIAYLRAAGRRACLTAVLDLYGRKVIGRALSGDTEAGHKDGVCQPGGMGGAGIPFGPGGTVLRGVFPGPAAGTAPRGLAEREPEGEPPG
jgi:transposase InsO family protein